MVEGSFRMSGNKEAIPPRLQRGIERLKNALTTMSGRPGVYQMISEAGETLYVGKAKNLKKRLTSYSIPEKLITRHKRLLSELFQVSVIITETETEALLLESNLIKKYKPSYNILLKDDKSFPYILLTMDHDFPRITTHRGKQSVKGKYFGPFASSQAVQETIVSIQKIFMIRNCQDSYFANRTRPCLQYHIKQCTAPCVSRIVKPDYAQSVKEAVAFLKGDSDKIQRAYAEKMQEASDAMDYEKAMMYRDKIRLLTKVQTYQRINLAHLGDADVMAVASTHQHTCVVVFFFRLGRHFGSHSFFLSHSQDSSPEENLEAFIKQFYNERKPPKNIFISHDIQDLGLIESALTEKYGTTVRLSVPKSGDRKDLVQHALDNAYQALKRKIEQDQNASFSKHFKELAVFLNSEKSLERIEIYDNSHLFGKDAYGIMVVATPEGFDRKSYRKFGFPNIPTGDDYAMMRQVMERRFKKTRQDHPWPMPDLLLIDGGKGQVGVVIDTLNSLHLTDIQVLGIAKGPNRNAGEETFFLPGQEAFQFDKNNSLLHFLQRLRDEAHRFAIGAHRSKRMKNLDRSSVDDISGIGPKRKKALLRHFGSAQNISQAALNDLLVVPGIEKEIAKRVYDFFHPDQD